MGLSTFTCGPWVGTGVGRCSPASYRAEAEAGEHRARELRVREDGTAGGLERAEGMGGAGYILGIRHRLTRAHGGLRPGGFEAGRGRDRGRAWRVRLGDGREALDSGAVGSDHWLRRRSPWRFPTKRRLGAEEQSGARTGDKLGWGWPSATTRINGRRLTGKTSRVVVPHSGDVHVRLPTAPSAVPP